MKKVFLIFVLMLSVSICFGQASIGSLTRFPNNKLVGLSYKPQLGVGMIGEQYLLVLRYTDAHAYRQFDENSVLLLKLKDDTVINLPICKELPVSEFYSTEYLTALKRYADFYATMSSYPINEDVLFQIVANKNLIKKIRVSFTNGDVQDWDIDEKYQPKLVEGLTKSLKSAREQNAERKTKLDNVEEGF